VFCDELVAEAEAEQPAYDDVPVCEAPSLESLESVAIEPEFDDPEAFVAESGDIEDDTIETSEFERREPKFIETVRQRMGRREPLLSEVLVAA
jgi:hypothetical protein